MRYCVSQHDLPFGGVGGSGMGHYHGKEGFNSCSKMRPVFHQANFTMNKYLAPPYTGWKDKIYRTLTKKELEVKFTRTLKQDTKKAHTGLFLFSTHCLPKRGVDQNKNKRHSNSRWAVKSLGRAKPNIAEQHGLSCLGLSRQLCNQNTQNNVGKENEPYP